MRIKIPAFATGVGLLQIQDALPAAAFSALLFGFTALALLLLGRCRHRAARIAVPLLCVALGFGWAALFAQQRLAEQLPEALEGRDLQLVGVIATLPQRFERGERFEFVVESVEWGNSASGARPAPGNVVPQRVVLSWYRGMHDDEAHEGRAVHPGERWRFTVRLKRPHGNANPYGFDYSVESMQLRKQLIFRC